MKKRYRKHIEWYFEPDSCQYVAYPDKDAGGERILIISDTEDDVSDEYRCAGEAAFVNGAWQWRYEKSGKAFDDLYGGDEIIEYLNKYPFPDEAWEDVK